MPLAPGTLLNNRYRIVSILGQGGMGAVYRASDEHLHMPVAVKENLFLTEEYGRQFRREAHILAGLRHPNLPHVTDYFSMENQVQYLVMDYIEGEDLRQRMERIGALTEKETILIGISICDALTYLHTRNPAIVHRDIKPGNIKVTANGQAVLVDFGLAKILQGGQITSTGARAMTPGYSPPEQYGTARTDKRSDIYSLGATLYAALTGVIPEDGLTRMTGKAKLTPIRDLAPKVSRRMAEIVEKALEIDPDERYATAEDMERDLIGAGDLSMYYQDRPAITPPPELAGEGNPIVDDEEASSQPPEPPQHDPFQPRKKPPARVYVLAGVAVLALALVVLALQPGMTRSILGNSPARPTETLQLISLQQTSTTSSPERPTSTPHPESSTTTTTATEKTPSPNPTGSATLAATQVVTPSATPRGGGFGQIAFASDKSGVMEVWLLDVNNPKNQRQVTDRKDGACQPNWSPDGMRIAFISPCKTRQDSYPGSNIYIINLDSTGNPDRSSVTQITSSLEGDFDPAWSPDGKRIAFTSLSNGKSAIYVINLEDLSLQELSHSIKSDKQPAWSPDGMQIAFVRQFLNSQIWYMADNGEPQRQFTFNGPVNNLWPAWSTDRQVIFYTVVQTSPDSTVPGLYFRKYEDRDNPNIENHIPTDPKSDIGPVFQARPSPDGFWLAYESWPEGTNHDIYIMSVNGSNISRLTTDPGVDINPAWRPPVKP